MPFEHCTCLEINAAKGCVTPSVTVTAHEDEWGELPEQKIGKQLIYRLKNRIGRKNYPNL